LDKLKAASFSKKLKELQNRVIDLQDKHEEQVNLLSVFAKHLTCLEEELKDEKDCGKGEV